MSRFLAFLLLLAVAGGGGAYYAVGTPHYSLWRLDRAIHDHDLPGFERYVDTTAITEGLVNDMWEDVKASMAQSKPSKNPWEELGRGFALAMIDALKPKVAEVAAVAVNQKIKDTMLHMGPEHELNHEPPPDFGLNGVQQEGHSARAEVTNKQTGKPLKLILSQQPDRHWRVVRLDYESFKALGLK